LNSFMCLFMPSLTSLIILFFLSWQFWGLNSGPHLVDRLSSTWATPPALFFCVVYFPDKISICVGWTWTSILLIPAPRVAGITGMSFWCLTYWSFLNAFFWILCLMFHPLRYH
jgi:hypothetical protein